MEVDHIFICVDPDANEAEILKQFGLIEGSANRHPGQGTSNRRFFFQNAFIELLYVHDLEEIQSKLTQPTTLYERLAVKSPTTSPFGICFRPTSDRVESLPFASWEYRPIYLPPHLNVAMSFSNLEEPLWFYLAFGSRPDAATDDKKQPLNHPIGFNEITSVHITMLDNPTLVETTSWTNAIKNFSLSQGNEHLLQIDFDHCVQGKSHDFRPILPLIFKW